MDSKHSFLEKKGLTEREIAEAFKRVPDTPSDSAPAGPSGVWPFLQSNALLRSSAANSQMQCLMLCTSLHLRDLPFAYRSALTRMRTAFLVFRVPRMDACMSVGIMPVDA